MTVQIYGMNMMLDFIKDIQVFWLPYFISQIMGIGLLLVAWKNTRMARGLFSVLFLCASIVNIYTSWTHPEYYLEYASFAMPLYRDFIRGWFSHFHKITVTMIAAGQLLIAIGMILKDQWVDLACIGSIIFLLSIAPLLVGSAFPFSITVSVAVWLILKHDPKNYLWMSGNGKN